MTPDLTNSPIMIGHDCTQCGATIPQCNDHIVKHGSGCCSGCFLDDTHGLLRSLDSAPAEMGLRVTDLEVQINRMTALLASFVIARSEHSKGIRRANAHATSHDEPIAKLLAVMEHQQVAMAALVARVVELEKSAGHVGRQQMRLEINDVDDRLAILERALPEIEAKVGLRRRSKAFERQKALPPGSTE